jgi:pyruvate kinase
VLAALRPDVPIHAVTFDERVARRLMLHRGLEPIAIDTALITNAAGVDIERHLVERGVLHGGQTIVFVSINADLTRPDANFLRIRRVG